MEEHLDLKDRKILFELEQDSRQSLQQIANKVGLKKETVFHRIRSLETREVIKKYLAEIDVYKLGYRFYPVLIRYENTTPKSEEDIYSYLKKNKLVAWLTKCEGAWDVNLTLIAKDANAIAEFFEAFLGKFGKYIADKHVLITSEIHYFKRGFWLEKPTSQTISTGNKKKIEVSEQDFRLLRAISNSAEKSLVELGKKLNSSPRNLAYRLRRLEKEKVIQGYRILVDFTKIGYKFYKIWFSLKNTTKKELEELMLYFQTTLNIIWATKTIGFYDLSIEMEVKDVGEFRKILDEIKHKFSHLIKKHESLLIFEEGVMNYLPE